MNDPTPMDPWRAGPVQVLPLSAACADALCRLAGSLGLATARVDLAGCTVKEHVLARTAAALAFPDWFGANWDALYDCLADREAGDGGRLLVFENAAPLRAEDPAAFDALVAILADVASEWAGRGVPFRAVVDA